VRAACLLLLVLGACAAAPPAPAPAPGLAPAPAAPPPPPTPPPGDSDLRPRFTAFGLLPRGQGHRPTCSVFTVVAAYEFAFATATGRPERLSVEYANWAANAANGRNDDGDFFHFTLSGFERFGICTESLWPYTPQFAGAVPAPDALVDGGRHLAIAAAQLRVRWVRPIDGTAGLTAAQFDDLVRCLAQGTPVAAGSAHSRLLVGYRRDEQAPGGGVFVTLDSALAAFAEVDAEFVRSKVNDAFVVEPAAADAP